MEATTQNQYDVVVNLPTSYFNDFIVIRTPADLFADGDIKFFFGYERIQNNLLSAFKMLFVSNKSFTWGNVWFTIGY